MEESLGLLRSDVRHIQSDVTDIKTEVRAVNVRLDKFQDKLDGARTDLTDKIDELRKDTTKEFTAVRAELGAKIEGVLGKVEGVRTELGAKIDGVLGKIDKLQESLATMKESLAKMQAWTMRLVYGLALTLGLSLLYTMARGFKWI